MTIKRIAGLAGIVLAAGIALGAAGSANATPAAGNLGVAGTIKAADVTPVYHGGYGYGYRRCFPVFRWVYFRHYWKKVFVGYRCFPRWRRNPYYWY